MTEKYGLIFDVDGVIADSETVNVKASVKVFEDLYGIKTVEKKDFEAGLGRGALKYMEAAALANDLLLTEKQLIEAANIRQDNFIKLLKEEPLPAFPGVIELIDAAMEDENIVLTIATSSTREKSMTVLNSAAIPYTKMTYITGSDVKYKKPHPELFTTACEKLGIPSEFCVVIEDAPNGVEAAHAAGCKCIAVTNSTTKENLIDADLIVDSLLEVDLKIVVGLINSNV